MRSRTYRETYAAQLRLMPYRDYWFWYGLLLALLIAVPFVANAYVLTFATTILVAGLGAVGLNLLTGTTGLISLGYAAFLAIGGYTAAILLTDYNWPLLPALFAAGIVPAALSLLVGLPSLRLKGLYLAITTLAFAIIANQVIVAADSITHGSAGISVARGTLFGLSMKSGSAIYWLALACTAIGTLAAVNIMRSRVGRAWSAIRDYDIAASLTGVNLTTYKLLAFAVSSFYIGVAGALLALHLRFLNVDSFGLLVSVEALTMIIVGGLGSVRGALLGAVFITLLPEVSRALFDLFGSRLTSVFSSNVQEVKGVIYGLAIIVFLRFEPDGLAKRWTDVKRFWLDWPLNRRRSAG